MLLLILSQIDYLAVILGTIAGMVVGGIWYMPNVFGKTWQESLGRNVWAMGKPEQVILVRAGSTLVTALSLAVLMIGGGVSTVPGALRLGLVVGVGVVASTIVADYFSARWPLKLILVTAGHRIVQILVMSAVIASVSRVFL